MIETITIPLPILSRNAVDKMHWSKKAKLRRQYEIAATVEMLRGQVPRADARSRYALTLVTYRIRPIADHDNLIGGSKQLIDALTEKHAGFIPDDRRECIGEPEIRQERCRLKKEERTVITRERI
jgi:hypothetical protein